MTDHWEGVAAVQWALPHILLTWNVIIIGHLTKFNKLFPKRPINHLGDTLTFSATRDHAIEVYFIHKTDAGTPKPKAVICRPHYSPILSVVSKARDSVNVYKRLLELQHMVVLLGQFTLAPAPCSPSVSPAVRSSGSNHVVKYERCSA